ncbi:MAG TPA: cation-translocating P-type ATPase [Vicinamibacterales bacterium]|nr:cation-translocating P-type ATPase [Vicinamibacterales bacterium]
MSTPVTCTVCELHAESTFKIEGMDCREEVALLERRFKNVAGIEDFAADVMAQKIHVKYDAAKINASVIADAVADTGMRAWLEHEEPLANRDDSEKRRRKLVWSAGIALGAGMLLGARHAPPSVVGFAYAWSIGAGLIAIWRRTWAAIRSGTLDINVLMTIAVIGAFAIKQYSEAATVIFLFAIAQMLEVQTLERARRAIRALIDLAPTEAIVRHGHGDHRVAVDDVKIGDVIVVRPGEKIPLDGEVVTGQSAVNQAPITGESLPIDKAAGDQVFAGTINGRGALDVRVTRARRDTTLAKIIHLVERAQAQRAPTQALIDRFARVYTPAVIVLAIAVAVVPPLAMHASWHDWFYRALVLLVVSCPCALVISTPVSIVAALAGAARKGVLIKGGAHLERLGSVRCVAFDKTGTLTRGALQVVDVMPLANESAASVLSLAAAVEQRSEHPIGHAIVQHAKASGVAPAPADGVRAFAGKGAEGLVDGVRVVLGNHRLFEEEQLCSPALHERLESISATGRTPVLVARNNDPVGIITVADRPRETSRDAIDLLKQQGIDAVAMLTGDSASTAAAIAAELGVDDVRAELLPEDKVAAVEDLRRRYRSVAMVGDGINDAPALASADVGIAMGAAGSDAALETADIALMTDELLKIPYMIRLSRATVRNIRANLAISTVMKAAFVIAAVAGVATLWMAVLADTGASVIVIANALRLLKHD